MNAVERIQLREVSIAEYEIRRKIGRGLRIGSAVDQRSLDASIDKPPATLTIFCDEAIATTSSASDVVAVDFHLEVTH